MKNLQILAISGSLRAKSSNTAVLQAASILAPAEIEIILYSGLANLPHFNPDLDCEPLPKEVISLRQQIKSSDAIIISSPEYAHGVPGSFKNALDWLVSSTEFPGKPIALINTNPRATIALSSLTEILVTMSAQIIKPANLTLDLAGKSLDAAGIVADKELAKSLNRAIALLIEAIS
ncbi:MAG: NAD(P)H-dependent oxidoreductase [Pleurocapsa sp. SU_5_0]|nr:NAD(P)H-dependent oxidoreductase [Pleurocapsa sp. SU_5_0]NJR44839.1 NAD(P)H-dependent oxidoreductase [Hyellaceae cyanobacterium CSU_1_1]